MVRLNVRIGALLMLVSAASTLTACGGTSSFRAPSQVGDQVNQSSQRLGLAHTSCLTATCMYVANVAGVIPNRARNGDGLLVYPAGAKGDVGYAERIYGNSFGGGEVSGVAVDASHNVYVASHALHTGSDWVTVYAAGAHGVNVVPIQYIAGVKTRIGFANGVGADPTGNAYVANEGCAPPICNLDTLTGVLVFAAGATGDVRPIREIHGPRTHVGNPIGVALDGSSNLYVLNERGVVVYAAGASGDVSPIQAISGSSTGLTAPTAIAVDPAGMIYVTNAGSSIEVFAPGASGNVAPIRIISGDKTRLESVGLAVDATGNAYSADYSPEHGPCCGRLHVFAADANGNVQPIQTVDGARSGLTHPLAIAVR
jgi:hypothetical protein